MYVTQNHRNMAISTKDFFQTLLGIVDCHILLPVDMSAFILIIVFLFVCLSHIIVKHLEFSVWHWVKCFSEIQSVIIYNCSEVDEHFHNMISVEINHWTGPDDFFKPLESIDVKLTGL